MGLIIGAPATLQRHFASCVAKKCSAGRALEITYSETFVNMKIFLTMHGRLCVPLTHPPLTSLLAQPKEIKSNRSCS